MVSYVSTTLPPWEEPGIHYRRDWVIFTDVLATVVEGKIPNIPCQESV
jgi:hypothetical protein